MNIWRWGDTSQLIIYPLNTININFNVTNHNFKYIFEHNSWLMNIIYIWTQFGWLMDTCKYEHYKIVVNRVLQQQQKAHSISYT